MKIQKAPWDSSVDYVAYFFILTITVIVTIIMLLITLTPITLHQLLGDCKLYANFGVYCPVCGGTRAFLSLLNGDLLKSLYYHPIVLYDLFLLTVFTIGRTIAYFSVGRINLFHAKLWWIYSSLGIVSIVCVIRNVLLLCFDISLANFA